MTVTVFPLALAVGLTALAALFVSRMILARRLAESRATYAGELAAAQALARDAQHRLGVLESELAASQERLTSLREEHAALTRDYRWLGEETARHREAVGSTKDLLDRADRQLRESFQALAAEALHRSQGAFLDLARTSFHGMHKEASAEMQTRQVAIDSMVQPIADSLRKVDARLDEAERERLRSFTQLMEQVTSLGTTAQTLARALTKRARAGGDRSAGKAVQ